MSKEFRGTLENIQNYLGQAQFRAIQLRPICEVLIAAGIHTLKPTSFVTKGRGEQGRNYLPKQNCGILQIYVSTVGSFKFTFPGKRQKKERLQQIRTQANNPLPLTGHCANSFTWVISITSHEMGLLLSHAEKKMTKRLLCVQDGKVYM